MNFAVKKFIVVPDSVFIFFLPGCPAQSLSVIHINKINPKSVISYKLLKLSLWLQNLCLAA